MSDEAASKTPSSTSGEGSRSTSEPQEPQGILVKLTGQETDEELDKLAEEIYQTLAR